MKTSIALIGFMGVGKSTVAKLLAGKLGKRLVEVDTLIALKANKSISRIFQEDGEITFRELEIETVKVIASQTNLIVDCGGGVVLNGINIDRLKQNAIVVWLTASPETITTRVRLEGNGRPLLQGKIDIATIREMICLRQPYYEAAADLIIDTSKADALMVVEQISNGLKENANFGS